ncbi:MAG: PKD domain-containing protein [Thermodesulfobacteriota bacterium]
MNSLLKRASLLSCVIPAIFININSYALTDLKAFFKSIIISQTAQSENLGNTPPIANAGNDKTALLNQTIVLKGTNSSDIDGDQLSFEWIMVDKPDDSETDLLNASSPLPSFTVDTEGEYTFSLVVNDGLVSSEADVVTISTSNSVPIADAGLDQTAAVGSRVTLNGAASSDPDGDPMNYSWALILKPESSSAELENPSKENPGFTADIEGTYILELNVDDGTEESGTDTVIISTENSKPVADAGEVLSTILGETVEFNGRNSFDVDEEALNYSWSILYKPENSTSDLFEADKPNPSFLPDVPGNYVAQLIVDDGILQSEPNTVMIRVIEESEIHTVRPKDNDSISKTLKAPSIGNTFYESVKFIFEGKNSVQKGVKEGAIDKENAAVIRGKVLTKEGEISTDVKVTQIRCHTQIRCQVLMFDLL